MLSEEYTHLEKRSLEELRELDAYFDRQLKGHSKEAGRRSPMSIRKVLMWAACALLSAVLPFIVLIRVSLYAYTGYGLNGWAALLAGIAATSLLLMGYALALNYAFTKTYRVHTYIRRGILAVVLAYCGYGLLYLSGTNAKNADVQSYYSSLHPVLRVSLSTVILSDNDLVITGLQRSPEDYEAMGLAANPRSKHFPQQDGYVHAADLRTLGRKAWKNRLTEASFRLLGFQTLRHVGTADHLHVSLPEKK